MNRNRKRIKQKIMALVAIALSIILPFPLNGDIGISILMLPLGIYLLLTKKRIIVWNAVVLCLRYIIIQIDLKSYLSQIK